MVIFDFNRDGYQDLHYDGKMRLWNAKLSAFDEPVDSSLVSGPSIFVQIIFVIGIIGLSIGFSVTWLKNQP